MAIKTIGAKSKVKLSLRDYSIFNVTKQSREFAEAIGFYEPTVAERMAALIEEYKDKIPSWARWVAFDADGKCYVFSNKPSLFSDCFCNAEVPSGVCDLLDRLPKDDYLTINWRETLTELPRKLTQEKPIANEQLPQRDAAYEMILADKREMSPQEREWMLKHGVSEQATTARQLPILPTEQAMPMMLGGEFGAQVYE